MLLHPAVVHFPVALWLTSLLFDIMARRTDDVVYRRAAYWLVGLGLLTAAVSIALGWVDLLAYERAAGVDPKFVRRHWFHSVPGYAATLVYLVNFIWRRRTGNRMSGGLLAVSVLGGIVIAAAGYLGGLLRDSM